MEGNKTDSPLLALEYNLLSSRQLIKTGMQQVFLSITGKKHAVTNNSLRCQDESFHFFSY